MLNTDNKSQWDKNETDNFTDQKDNRKNRKKILTGNKQHRSSDLPKQCVLSSNNLYTQWY